MLLASVNTHLFYIANNQPKANMIRAGLRISAMICYFMIFASAAIVTGVMSFFLNRYSFRGSHVVYQEVIVRAVSF